ncbi:hypothetical protein [Stutzerimonas nitrititolerans]|uniref:hypothetical protein n=1 Tax=Stutzerimonas nitrititolerans TaxID=2482751 RepID=UPI0028996823|nr:hypothetical protein [Stutzerimonas nitrititolerans]
MRTKITRLVGLFAFGLICTLGGAYLGINQVYDRLDAELPAIIESAGCIPSS